jgi:hypothetical protein
VAGGLNDGVAGSGEEGAGPLHAAMRTASEQQTAAEARITRRG